MELLLSFLHSMEALSCLRRDALSSICLAVRYQRHDANDILYWSVPACLCAFTALARAPVYQLIKHVTCNALEFNVHAELRIMGINWMYSTCTGR